MLFGGFLVAFWWLFGGFLVAFWWLFGGFLVAFWWLFERLNGESHLFAIIPLPERIRSL
ncbi:hypothetical protein [Aeromonas caviae]|uniref:hypothetical protein n=1 Tax=Aeromonas caviae TaxID=648 RepID=UPI001F16748A|nr:hypothetical protein [Aeromonas caviae]